MLSFRTGPASSTSGKRIELFAKCVLLGTVWRAAQVHNAYQESSLKKEIVGGGANKIAPFREATIHPHNKKIKPAAGSFL
jgi:hypothetical protein